jgi:pimeloyl-ACP methyl ester carboxylesterase
MARAQGAVRKWLTRLFYLLVILVLSLLVHAWQPDRPLDTLTARWAPAPSQWIEVDGVNVHLRDEGPRDDALPLVLLHGTSASLHTWDGWAAALTPQRRVIRMDLPGFGLTGPVADGDYRLPRHVAYLTHLLDRLQVQKAVLVGNSFGGQVAWATALLHPERVGGLVLIDAVGYPFQPKSIPMGFRLARNPWSAPLMRYLLTRELVAASVRNTYGDPSRLSDAVIDRYFELTLRAGNRGALMARFGQSTLDEMSERIGELKLPTLIMWGGLDRLIPPENADLFHADIAGSELRIFPELGHVPQEEDAAQTVAAAMLFLQARACGSCGQESQSP